VEKYRNIPEIIPEIGRELNVSYFVEGSGQKVGDKILLNVQLIAASKEIEIPNQFLAPLQEMRKGSFLSITY
jgi:TolB-like protein